MKIFFKVFFFHIFMTNRSVAGARAILHLLDIRPCKIYIIHALKWGTVDICILTESRVIAKSIHQNWGKNSLKMDKMQNTDKTACHRPLRHANRICGIKNALKWRIVHICSPSGSWSIVQNVSANLDNLYDLWSRISTSRTNERS